jgi:hypothetical protein
MSNPQIQDSLTPKKINWGAVGAISAVVVAGGAYVAWQFLGGKELTPLQAAELIPQDALITGYISTDSQAWSKLDKFGTPEARQLIDQSVANFKKQVLEPDKLDFEQDLQSWMGNIMFAVLPQAKETTGSDNALIVIGIKNKLKALDFANKLKSQSKTQTKESDYKGITITEVESDKKAKTIYAVVDDKIILTSAKKTLERSIDTLKGEPSIVDREGTKELFAKGINLANPVAKFWITDFVKLVQQANATNPDAAAIPPETLQEMAKIKAMELGTGFHFQTITKIDPSLIPETYKTTESKILSRLPATTILAVNGRDISQNWAAVIKQLEANTELKQGLEQMRKGFKQSLQLDFDQDLIGWMNGEFAFALVETQQGTAASYGMGGSMVFETSNRATAENTFQKIDDLIAAQGGGFITKQEKEVEGKKVTEWLVQNAVLFSHTWIDNNSLAISFGTPFSDAVAAGNASLKDSPNFQAITGNLPSNNYGYFYVDVEKILGVMNRLGATAYMPAEINAVMNSVKGFGGSATLPDQNTSQTDMLLHLRPTETKK